MGRMRSLIYKALEIKNKFDWDVPKKVLPLGRRLTDWCREQDSQSKIEKYLIFYVTNTSFKNDWKDFVDNILENIDAQDLQDNYDVKTIEDAKLCLTQWIENLIREEKYGYLIVNVKITSRLGSRIDYIRQMSFVNTTPPTSSGIEEIVVPQPKGEKAIIVDCLKSKWWRATPTHHTVKIKGDTAYTEDSKGVKTPFYFDEMQEMKNELFDAPTEVKQAFNNMVEYFDKIKLNLDDQASKLDLKIKDKVFYTNEQLQFIAAYALAQFPYISEIIISKSKNYDYSNERQTPTGWTPKEDGVEFKVAYEGRVKNDKNSLNAVLAVKEGIRMLEKSSLHSADHLYVYHNARKNLVNVHYKDENKKDLYSPDEARKSPYNFMNRVDRAVDLSKKIKLIGA